MHLKQLLALLELESDAEAQQTLERIQRLSAAEAERTGHALTALIIPDQEVALGGRLLLTLCKRGADRMLPWNRLSVGTPVLLFEEGVARPDRWRGIVCGRDERSLRVAFDQAPEPEQCSGTFRLDLAPDEVAHRRQRAALEHATAARSGRLAQLRDSLLGERAPAFGELSPVQPLNPGLNPSQRQAVEFALSAEDLAIIHGPPGTGKTTTVIEVIRQAVRRGEKVLACAPSNLGVDNLLERLVAAREQAVRLGHPARVLPELQEHTLDLMVAAHPDVRLARKLVQEARTLRSRAGRTTRAKPARGARSQMREEARQLMADARRLEARAVAGILDSSTVVCATLTGLDDSIVGNRTFDLVIIDEAAQATEPACWIPLLRSHRVVLAGDHCQLPPTIVSVAAARGGLGTSLMERLIQDHGPGISRLLQVQYRMHETIMGFSSAEFYESALEADASVHAHTLDDLPGVTFSSELTSTPFEFVDTAGAGYEEQAEPDGRSRWNPEEAELVVRRVHALLDAGVAPRHIAVISPYAAQVRHLRDRLGIPQLDVDTVDGFQGREKEAVLISLVRSNLEGAIGFLADIRRMNVALTRARRKLIVVGDSATISAHEFYQRLLEYVEQQGGYRTVWEAGS
jgi:ATP-dependent RNA/DNA helicase IGHMBP2